MLSIPFPHDLLEALEQVEQIIDARLRARPALTRVGGEQLSAPAGPRIRAALALLAAQAGASITEPALHAAAAVELIYAATQLHDGLLDERARRGAQAEGAFEGAHSLSLMVGDYLFALAAAEMALAPDARIIAFYSQSVMAVCEGELAPVRELAPLESAVAQYLVMIESRSASLFEAACKAGAVCGGAPEEQVEAFGRFGHALGLAWRIGEDVLDYRGAARALRAGRITLPLIYAASAAPEADLAHSVDGQPDDARAQAAAAAVLRAGGDTRAADDARRFAAEALALLPDLPAGPARDALAAIAAFASERLAE